MKGRGGRLTQCLCSHSFPFHHTRRILDLEERMDTVEATVQELSNDLQGIFAKHNDEERLKGIYNEIYDTPYLYDYFTMLHTRVVSMAVASSAVASGMVTNTGSAGDGGVMSGLMGATGALEYLGENIGLPFAGVATALIAGAAHAYEERQKALRVQRMQEMFGSPNKADEVAELTARDATLRIKDYLSQVNK